MEKEKTLHLESVDCSARLAAIEDAVHVIGGKWKLRIIIGLMEGNKRFNELQRLVKGISPKVLSSELKTLEINGFVKRNVFLTAMPVIVEYELTEYSSSLNKVLEALVEWGVMHRQSIKARF